MNKDKYFLSLIALICFSIFLPKAAMAQLVLGQYEDEAPLRTWNNLGIITASSLAMGETHFALASDSSVSLTNPALLSRLPRFTFTLSSSSTTASMFKFSLFNTGVISTDENRSIRLYALDFGGISVRLKGWAVSVNYGVLENYDRPKIRAEYASGNRLEYYLNFKQEGMLKNLNVAFSLEFFRRISLGIGLNFVSGNLEKNVEEKWFDTEITITDNKNHEFKGFYVNGGLVIDLSNKFTAAAIFRMPYKKKSDSDSLIRYQSPRGDTDIKIEASAKNIYSQPLVLGVGFSYKFNENLLAVSDFSFFNWSRYKIDYFEEKLERNFKDIVKIGAGLQYLTSTRIFGRNMKIPYRIGFIYDPQPMKESNSYYLYLSYGMGLQMGTFYLDISGILGKESGSGNNLSAQKIVFTMGFKI